MTRKIGKKVCQNIEQQIEDLLRLRSRLVEISSNEQPTINVERVTEGRKSESNQTESDVGKDKEI